MKAISIWNPWASFIAHGFKTIETRSWPYRGVLPEYVAIHSAKAWTRELHKMSRMSPFADLIRAVGFSPGHDHPKLVRPRGMLFGKIVAVGRLVECVSTDAVSALLKSDPDGKFPCLAPKLIRARSIELKLGDYSPGRYCWVFDNVKRLENPIDAVGRQGIFSYDERTNGEVQEWLYQIERALDDRT